MRASRRLARSVLVLVSRTIGGLFYSREYLRGRWFDERAMGWKWMWRGLLFQKLMGFNRHLPWPCSPHVTVSNPRNIVFDPDDLNNFHSFGVYYQNFAGRIVLGKGTYIAPNVGIITSNHVPGRLDEHLPGKDVVLGEGCWIGMNAVLLPGVALGANTVVGAGAVVTKSFPEGDLVIAGNPARPIRSLKGPASEGAR